MAELGNVLGVSKTKSVITDEQLSPTGVATYFEVPSDSVLANAINLRVNNLSIAGDTLIWGNTEFGIWGSFNWGNSNETGFVLGNSLAGVLGTNLLGINQSDPIRVAEALMFIDINEEFSDTTYLDSSNTTATGWGTGSLSFSSSGAAYDMSVGSYTATVAVNTGSVQLS